MQKSCSIITVGKHFKLNAMEILADDIALTEINAQDKNNNKPNGMWAECVLVGVWICVLYESSHHIHIQNFSEYIHT